MKLSTFTTVVAAILMALVFQKLAAAEQRADALSIQVAQLNGQVAALGDRVDVHSETLHLILGRHDGAEGN